MSDDKAITAEEIITIINLVLPLLEKLVEALIANNKSWQASAIQTTVENLKSIRDSNSEDKA